MQMERLPSSVVAIVALLQHPQLGPATVHWLPLVEVLENLQLVSVEYRDRVEDVLVEAYVQECIQSQAKLHRLHSRRPHYWIDANSWRKDSASKSHYTDRYKEPNLVKVMGKLLKAPDFDAALLQSQEEKDEQEEDENEQGDSDSDESDVTNAMGLQGCALKLRDYLVENVLTTELKRIGDGVPDPEVHPSLPAESEAHSFSLPESVHDLPGTFISLVALYHARKELSGLEVLTTQSKWWPRFPGPVVNKTTDGSDEESDEYEIDEDEINQDDDKVDSSSRGVAAFATILQEGATNLRELSLGITKDDSRDENEARTVPHSSDILYLASKLPMGLEKLSFDKSLSLKDTPLLGTSLSCLLVPLAKVLSERQLPHLRHLELPKLEDPVPADWDELVHLRHFEPFFESLGSLSPTLRTLVWREKHGVGKANSPEFIARLQRHLPDLTCVELPRLEIQDLKAFLTPQRKAKLRYFCTQPPGYPWQDEEDNPGRIRYLSDLEVVCPHIFPWSAATSNSIPAPIVELLGTALTSLKLIIKGRGNSELERALRVCGKNLHTLEILLQEGAGGAATPATPITDEIGVLITQFCGANLKTFELRNETMLNDEDSRSDGKSDKKDHGRLITDQLLLNLKGCRALERIDVDGFHFSVQALMWCTKTQWPELTEIWAVSTHLSWRSIGGQSIFPEDPEDWVPTAEVRPKLMKMECFSEGFPEYRETKRPWEAEYLLLMRKKGGHLLDGCEFTA